MPRIRRLLTRTLTVIALLVFALATARRFTRFPGFEYYGRGWQIWTGHESVLVRHNGNDFDLIWEDVDYWRIILIAGAWPALQLAKAAIAAERRRRAERRAAPQFPHCTQCGYDLRATPDRCPECGQVATGPPRESLER